MQSTIKCKNCGEQFSSKWNLMYHRKSKHLNTVAFCRNNLGGNCPYSDDMCWWNHGERQEEKVSCYICNTTFETKAHIMIHRKEEHAETVRLCT